MTAARSSTSEQVNHRPVKFVNIERYLARQYDNALTAADLKCKLRFDPHFKAPAFEHFQFWTLQNEYQKTVKPEKRARAPACEAIRSESLLKSRLCKQLWDEHHFFLPMQAGKKVIDLMALSLTALHKQSILPTLDPSLFLTMQGRHSSARVLPALLLASNLLSKTESMEFLHALIFGHRTEDKISEPNTDAPGATRFWRVYKDKPLPKAEIEKVHSVLSEIATNMDYKFLPIEAKIGKLGGNCCIGKATETDGIITVKFHIAVHEEKYTALGDLTGSETGVLRAWFNLAAILIHEIAHAVGIHVAAKRKLASIRDPIFEDGKPFDETNPGELGHALERQLFGTDWADSGLDDREKMAYFESLFK